MNPDKEPLAWMNRTGLTDSVGASGPKTTLNSSLAASFAPRHSPLLGRRTLQRHKKNKEKRSIQRKSILTERTRAY